MMERRGGGRKRLWRMRYEIYLDALIIKLSVFQFCTLALVNLKFCKVSNWGRITAGAVFGAVVFGVATVVPVNAWLKYGIVAMAGLLTLLLSFPIHTIRGLERTLEEYLKYAVLIGGILWMILRRISHICQGQWKYIMTILLCILLLVGVCGRRIVNKHRGDIWKATLVKNGKKICLRAIMDTGNALYEPISGKAVCVMDPGIAGFLWSEREPYRVIPYHCVGVEHGLMKGYMIDELRLEKEGPSIICRDVVVAVSPQKLTRGKEKGVFLIHPKLTPGGDEG